MDSFDIGIRIRQTTTPPHSYRLLASEEYMPDHSRCFRSICPRMLQSLSIQFDIVIPWLSNYNACQGSINSIINGSLQRVDAINSTNTSRDSSRMSETAFILLTCFNNHGLGMTSRVCTLIIDFSIHKLHYVTRTMHSSSYSSLYSQDISVIHWKVYF